jgi:hypothetical protein
MLQLEKELRENLPVPSEKAKAALSELIKQTEDEPITEEFVDPRNRENSRCATFDTQ